VANSNSMVKFLATACLASALITIREWAPSTPRRAILTSTSGLPMESGQDVDQDVDARRQCRLLVISNAQSPPLQVRVEPNKGT